LQLLPAIHQDYN